jgi:transposase
MEVAARLGVSRQMLYLLVERYEQRSDLPIAWRVLDGEHSGRPASKRELVMRELEVLLGQPPSEYGYRAQTWTVGMLRTQIQRKHSIEVSEDTVQRALYDLRHSCKRPRYVLARRDPHWQQAKGGYSKD